MGENVTPVLKRTAKTARIRLYNNDIPTPKSSHDKTPVSAFDDSFVQFSDIKEETEMEVPEMEKPEVEEPASAAARGRYFIKRVHIL